MPPKLLADTTGGAYSSSRPIAGEKGARCTLPKNPTSTLGPVGLWIETIHTAFLTN